MIIFLDIPDVEVEGLEVTEEILLTLRTISATALCPSCGTASSRIQSRYTRTLRDLPSVGRPIRLIMQVRRFFCKKTTCAQKIFVERLPDLCRPHARAAPRGCKKRFATWDFSQEVRQGQTRARELGISGSRDTILRLVRQAAQPARQEPRVIGLDDWGATRSYICSCKNSRKEDLTWGSALSALPG
jgi:transposase